MGLSQSPLMRHSHALSLSHVSDVNLSAFVVRLLTFFEESDELVQLAMCSRSFVHEHDVTFRNEQLC